MKPHLAPYFKQLDEEEAALNIAAEELRQAKALLEVSRLRHAFLAEFIAKVLRKEAAHDPR